jgi:hypothetical protein
MDEELNLPNCLESLKGLEAEIERPVGAPRVDHFEWPRIATRMNMVYEAVLEQRPLPSFQLADVTL